RRGHVRTRDGQELPLRRILPRAAARVPPAMTNLWTVPDAPALLRDAASRAAVRGLLLAIADDELVLGHRHSEWTGFAPDIESDVAMSSIAQEDIGHARVLYDQIAALDGTSA